MNRFYTLLAAACITCIFTLAVLMQLVIFQAKHQGEPSLESNQVMGYQYMDDKGNIILSLEDVELFASIVMSECGNTEPDEGVCAVAECLRNAILKDKLPVIEAAKRYQYAGVMEPTIRVRAICLAVLYHDLRVLDDEDALWFYAPAYGMSDFHEGRKLVASIGGHNFYK